MKPRTTYLAGALVVTLAAAHSAAAATPRISLIRDAEIENIIGAYAAPLFAAAGLDGAAVKVHLVNDGRLNAFVAGGMNLFINTGLLLASESANQVIGVIAHETGHIAGGHLVRTEEALRGASGAAILSSVLGAAAIIAGAPQAGTALIVGGQELARQSILQYSRTQEQSADQFAVTTLDRTGQSAQGLLEFLETLADREGRSASRRDLYLRTHPITRDRVTFVRHHVAGSAYTGASEPLGFGAMFQRMQAKLHGCFDSLEKTYRRYPESNNGVEARYARAFALANLSICRSASRSFRSDVPRALGEIDSLIAEHATEPYFHELKGQMLFENGRVGEAVGSFRRAVELLPDSPLLRVGLAEAMIQTGDASVLGEAGEHLETAVRADRDSAKAWHLLSIVYGRGKRFGMSALASAEHALNVGRSVDAIGFAKRASIRLPYGSPGQLRAEDIQRAAKYALKKKK